MTIRLFLAWIFFFLLSSGAAWAQDSEEAVDAFEEELFGGTSEEGNEPVEEPAETVAEESMSDASIAERLAVEDESLALGAYAYFRLQYAAQEEGDPETFPLTSPSFFDLFVDGRPNDRLRVYARGRLTTDFTRPKTTTEEMEEETVVSAAQGMPEQERVSVALDQLWLKFDVARAAFVTLGKQRVRWGTGRFWNPTDFLNQTRLDPLSVAVYDERLGVSLLKIHVPFESLGSNLYAVASLDEAHDPESVGGALRAEFLYGLTEVALSTSIRKNNPLRLGADLSTGVWLFDVRLEAALFHNDRRAFYEDAFELPATFPTPYSREDDWIPQVVAGTDISIQYSDEDTLTLGAEYFFNDLGYDDEAIYPWLAANGAFTPFYLGRHYGALYGVLPAPGTWDDSMFTVSLLGNISDASYIGRFDFSQTILTELRFNAFVNGHFGSGEFKYGYELPPNSFAPSGFSIIPPLFEVGVGLSLNL